MIYEIYPFDIGPYVQVYERNPQAFNILEITMTKDGNFEDISFVYVNEAFEKLSGLSRSSLIGKTYTEVMSKSNSSKFYLQPWMDLYGPVAYQGGHKNAIMPEVNIGSGGEHLFSVQCFQIAEGFVGVNYLDITERMGDEDKRLRKFNEIIMANSGLFVWEIDFLNNAYYKIAAGETRGYVTKMENPIDYLSRGTDNEGKVVLKTLYKAACNGESKTATIRFVLEGIDESLFFMITVIPEKDKNGEVKGMFGITQDVTDQQRAEESLKRALSTNNSILQEAALSENDFIVLLDFEKGTAELRYGSWFIKGIEGTPVERRLQIADLSGRMVKSFLSKKEESERFSKMLDPVLLEKELFKEGKKTFVFDFTMQETENSTVRKMFRFAPLDSKRRTAVMIMTDITDTYLKDLQLEEALRVAEEANMAKLDFISRISHDIRTPLSAVKSMTEFAFQDIGDEEKLKHDLTNIKNSGEFLNSLINDILDVSKLDSGQTELHPEPYSYKRCREEFGPLVRTEAKNKGINLKVEDSKRNIKVMIDPTRIRQVALNIIMNAMKYTPSGGTVSISVKGEPITEKRIMIILTVEDTGIGMSEKFMSHLFEPFRQDDTNAERRKLGGGTGLGLYIVKRMTELMDGTVKVESELSKGTRVTVRIPADIALSSESEDDRQENKTETEVSLSGRALLFEDNFINTEIALRILSTVGMEAIHAGNGEEGVELFEKSEEGYFDIILMDIQMPLMNGYDAAKAIRALDREDAKNIPIIAMTADVFEEAKKHALESGMNDYITKPLDMKRVKELLANYVS